MTERLWLIRTQSNHIMGPLRKDRIIELFRKGSIRGDDEICSGNGYWFHIKEKPLLERYLFSDTEQAFNPVSEAEDVVGADASPQSNVFRLEDFEDSFQNSKLVAKDTPEQLDVDKVLEEVHAKTSHIRKSNPQVRKAPIPKDSTSEIFLENKKNGTLSQRSFPFSVFSTGFSPAILFLTVFVLSLLFIYVLFRFYKIEIPLDELFVGRTHAQSIGELKKKNFLKLSSNFKSRRSSAISSTNLTGY